MAAMVQTYPQQTSTVTMLQSRPTSTAGMVPSHQGQPNHQYMASQAPRSVYHGNGAPTGYRGGSAPVQQYAFTSTPNLNQSMPWQQQYGAYRTNSSPAVPVAQTYDMGMAYRGRAPNSMSQSQQMAYMHQMGVGQTGSRDDSALPMNNRNMVTGARPHSAYLGSSQPTYAAVAASKAAPDRYRRQNVQPAPHARSQSMNAPSTLAMGNANQSYNTQNGAKNQPQPRPHSFYGSLSTGSMDDIHMYGQPTHEEGKRVRRGSLHTVDSREHQKASPLEQGKEDILSLANTLSYGPSADKNAKSHLSVPKSSPTHQRHGSAESVSSSRSSHSRPGSATNRSASVSTNNPSLAPPEDTPAGKHDNAGSPNIPSRGSSSDAMKRTLNPSPLSKPATMATGATEGPSNAASGTSANLDSPAAKQLAALNQKGGKAKGKTSRLRRAFSFGSAAELRKAGMGDNEEGTAAPSKPEPSKLHKEPTPEEAYDAEQARIAEAQEASGLGNSIYGGRFFGSTDNLSISSTASSASIMLRKMGRGVKKSTRSLAGLFRPKSVIGVPAAEPLAPEASQATVSMITVEAETQRVNVTADPQTTNGVTGFPHLERNSMDAAQIPDMVTERLGSSGTDNSNSRKSIVGGDRERAEVLAAVRKGILKRSASPSIRPADASPDLELPSIPTVADSPNSSAPSTPNDEAQGHKRTGSVAISNDDYFISALRFRQDSKSAPVTPQGAAKRNATFSPRIIFHDTWPSQEYDRRGEIATCNRLTPMLAQQIKEELNSFKMEMEVHENSKIYTHFF